MVVNKIDMVWSNMIFEAKLLLNSEPLLMNFLYMFLLKHNSFKDALVYMLSTKLSNVDIKKNDLIGMLKNIYEDDNDIVISAAWDVYVIRLNDPSVSKYITPFLYFKGFHALQAYRIIHWLWNNNREELAMYFYNCISVIFNVDIHPAAKIGRGIMLDHATGVVIGETAVIENNVSIMQSVTLGSTGKIQGNRHPKIKQDVLIGAGAIVLGNIEIGCGAKIGAGSIVLHSVPPYSTVTGKSAQLVS
ncbi:serine acetyltransferase [Candidatus Blochmanniella vafra str. BVAF]|uniref:Serine acetyltransferase n=1 Tax=Blochmanniella vafra (strain BVAF) TaxID=859654 RepID=E8Q782_BLOVB|nr:serine O-acetyltransferase [Candidatus Blochmannia vafer]ADV33977.1 serine acetyltransferase [Candidatus Blochmannia vafer str. BVAF]